MLRQCSLLLLWLIGTNAQSCQDFVVQARLDNVILHGNHFAVSIEDVETGQQHWKTGPFNDTLNSTTKITSSACLDHDKCWKATVYLSKQKMGDGVERLRQEGDGQGGFLLTFGADIVGSYDGTVPQRQCYDQQWYVFGDGCKAAFAPTEGFVADSECIEARNPTKSNNELLCVRFEFKGLTDGRHVLVGTDDKIVWNETASSQMNQDDRFFKTKCLDATKCYRFTVFDASSFPIESSGAHTHRVADSFSVAVDGGPIGAYNATTDGCFTAKWHQFGLCPNGRTNGTIGQEACPVNDETKAVASLSAPFCSPVAFTIFTDEYPMDVSYQLTNADGSDIWKVDANTLMDQNSLYYRESCLASDDCYTFKLYDSDKYQDGLTEVPTGGTAGWFRLDFSNSQIAYYDGISENACYETQGFRFGDTCQDSLPKSSTRGDCQVRPDVYETSEEKALGCLGLQVYIYTDRFPEDTRIVLNDSTGFTIWDERPGNKSKVNQLIDRDICLNPFDCYNLTLYDSAIYSDGLTKPPIGGSPGRFNLTFGSNMVGAYDGATDGCFTAVWFVFGEMCQGTVVKTRTAGSECSVARPLPEPVPPSSTPSSAPSTEPTKSPSQEQLLTQSDKLPLAPSLFPSAVPSFLPIHSPSSAPTPEPTKAQEQEPTKAPSQKPTKAPSQEQSQTQSAKLPLAPSLFPSAVPSFFLPSHSLSSAPSPEPRKTPSQKQSPTQSDKRPLTLLSLASNVPTFSPSHLPSTAPSPEPTKAPSTTQSDQLPLALSSLPSDVPSFWPSHSPSSAPSPEPKKEPSQERSPTRRDKLPLALSSLPSDVPSFWPSHSPLSEPTPEPTKAQEQEPTKAPSQKTTKAPSQEQSQTQSAKLPLAPSLFPSAVPSFFLPSHPPSSAPSPAPRKTPSQKQSPTQSDKRPLTLLSLASNVPTFSPSHLPSTAPSPEPTKAPSTTQSDQLPLALSSLPSDVPSFWPSHSPSPEPKKEPSQERSPTRSNKLPLALSSLPSDVPSFWPSHSPLSEPKPTKARSQKPTKAPSQEQLLTQSAKLPLAPLLLPSHVPAILPSHSPSSAPSPEPTKAQSQEPSLTQSNEPSLTPSLLQSHIPSFSPGHSPSVDPSLLQSQVPTKLPSRVPSLKPTQLPSHELPHEPAQEIDAPEQKVEECTNLELALLHDEFPEDLSIVLMNERMEKIWDLHDWEPSQAGVVYSKMTCLDPTLCYRIEIQDKYADGLTRPTGSGTGSFSLVYDDKLIGSYNGTGCFSKIWYQFGANCTLAEGFEGGSCINKETSAASGDEGCDSFAFSVQLDRFPEDVSLFLKTDDHEIWKNERPWGPQHAGQKFEQIECLKNGCYTFSVFDQYNDGLTKAMGGSPEGSFNVTYRGELVGSYDAREDKCYSVFMFQFGSGCKTFPKTLAVANVVSDGDCRDERRRLNVDSP